MITTVNCGLSLQLTCLLVNLSTCKLPLMITDINYGLSLQLTHIFVNLSTTNTELRISLIARILIAK